MLNALKRLESEEGQVPIVLPSTEPETPEEDQPELHDSGGAVDEVDAVGDVHEVAVDEVMNAVDEAMNAVDEVDAVEETEAADEVDETYAVNELDETDAVEDVDAADETDAVDEVEAVQAVPAGPPADVTEETDPPAPPPSLKHADAETVWTAPPIDPSTGGLKIPVRELRPPRPITPFEDLVQIDLADPHRGVQYRELTANLLAKHPAAMPRSLMFVGAGYRGHVTAALGCVGTLAVDQGPGSVLLLDADPADRELTHALEMADEPGLGDVLAGRTAWHDLVMPTATERLHVLPAGGDGFTPSAASGIDLERLLDELNARWQWVLVDGGNVGSPLAESLAAACDGTYLLVQLGETGWDDAADAVADLQAAGGRVLGCIVTNVPVPQAMLKSA